MKSFETPEAISVNVDLFLGDVRVTASDRADTVATIQPTNESNAADVRASDQTLVDYADGLLTINAPKNWRRFTPFDDSGSVQVVLEVPTGSSLQASTTLGDIAVEGELDRCRLKTAMGDVRVDHSGPLNLKTSHGNVDVDRVRGDADIATTSGEVRVGRVAGAAIVRNGNGATYLGDVAGDVRVKAANGDISIARAGRSIVAKTATGSIEVGELRRGEALLETAAGDLSCGVAGGTAVNLDVRCKRGRINSALEATAAPGPSEEHAELRAHTTVGDITLYRTEPRESSAS